MTLRDRHCRRCAPERVLLLEAEARITRLPEFEMAKPVNALELLRDRPRLPDRGNGRDSFAPKDGDADAECGGATMSVDVLIPTYGRRAALTVTLTPSGVNLPRLPRRHLRPTRERAAADAVRHAGGCITAPQRMRDAPAALVI
jgi:hypothetical protein